MSLFKDTKGYKVLILSKEQKQENCLNESLIKVIVRSFYWHKLLVTGKTKNTKEIQKLENLKDNSYIKQVLKLRFLLLKIIELILSGKQSRNLTVSKLFEIKTLNWQEQEQLIIGQ